MAGEFEGVFSDDEDNEDYEEDNENIISPNELDINDFYKDYDKNKKNFKTSPVLTKYEKTRILSERVQQISNGAIPFISNPESYPSIHDIALKELDMKKLPFIIKRSIHGNKYELWKLEDLKIINMDFNSGF
jgi:DNA-directed RNA polymerase subunit K/omega|tara:strand:+ start:1424 stop:1819 length:396 start_codon:yes stop_codon:yes gene_type:complete